MMMQQLHLIYFSPTKTTKTILEQIALGIGAENIYHMDLSAQLNSEMVIKNSLVLLGVPVYRGRIPIEASEQLKKIKGINSNVVLVAVYGNRDYDDTLIELKDIAEDGGFRPIAAAAFIGEHSFSTDEFPIAVQRPDNEDKKKAQLFGKQIKVLLESNEVLKRSVDVPGNRPYKELGVLPDVAPVTNEDNCDKCGVCVEVCPTDAISLNGKLTTDSTACILCCACVKACPSMARYNDNEFVNTAAAKLNKFCSERKEPELFL